jgi:hypothetical protein
MLSYEFLVHFLLENPPKSWKGAKKDPEVQRRHIKSAISVHFYLLEKITIRLFSIIII